MKRYTTIILCAFATAAFSAQDNIPTKNDNLSAAYGETTFERGRAALLKGETDEALLLFIRAYDLGNADAANEIGLIFHRLDPKQAAQWYRRAAEMGRPGSQCILAEFYLIGMGVPQDNSAARKWFTKAAEQNDERAANYLGEIYAEAKGVARDYSEALKWYRKAAELGHAGAQSILGLWYYEGDKVPRVMETSIHWLKKAAAHNQVEAQNLIGHIYASGDGVARDEVEGLAWFNIAAASREKSAVENRNSLERKLGAESTLAAQQRSKAIVVELQSMKDHEMEDLLKLRRKSDGP